MDRAWVGFARMLLFLGLGIAVLVKGWRLRRTSHEKSVGEDYLLLVVSGLVVAVVLVATVYWTTRGGSKYGPVYEGAVLVFLLILAAVLAYGSNRLLRHKKGNSPEN